MVGAPQVYKLYAADGLAKDFNVAPSRSVDPATCGWKLIAAVDARPADGKAGGQYGVSIGDATTTIAHCSYILFDVHATEHEDIFGNTFYSEIDVLSGIEPLKPASVRSTPRVAKALSTPSEDEARAGSDAVVAGEVLAAARALLFGPRGNQWAIEHVVGRRRSLSPQRREP